MELYESCVNDKELIKDIIINTEQTLGNMFMPEICSIVTANDREKYKDLTQDEQALVYSLIIMEQVNRRYKDVIKRWVDNNE